MKMYSVIKPSLILDEQYAELMTWVNANCKVSYSVGINRIDVQCTEKQIEDLKSTFGDYEVTAKDS